MAVNMDKLNAFVGQFVGDLAAVHSRMVVIGEKLGRYKALVEGQPEISRARTTGMDVARSTGAHSDTKFSESCAISWRKRRQIFELRRRVIAAAALAYILRTWCQIGRAHV